MANKQHFLILLFLQGVIVLVTNVDSKCPNNQVCDCTDDYIKCNCNQREEVIFNRTTEGDDGFIGEEIIIIRCGRVKMAKLSLGGSNLQLLYISDLLELQIESFSFYQAEITNLYISKIGNFKLESQGFGDVKHINNLTMSEVTIGELEPSIFSKTQFRHLAIKNSRIGTMKSRSLEPLNCESIAFENSSIHSVSASAINVGNITKFAFLHNSINTTKINSFTLPFGKEVDFGHCRFLQISSNMISAKHVESFSFHDNTVTRCEENAFWGVRPTKEARFVDNNIIAANVDSLIPNNGPNDPDFRITVSENNTVGCDCNIEWLIKSKGAKYTSFKERNKCFYPESLEGLRLSALTVREDKDDKCSFLTDKENAFSDSLKTNEVETIDLITTNAPSDVIPVTTVSEEHITRQSRVISKGHITKDGHSSKQQIDSCQCKDKSNNNSERIALCHIIFILIPLVILIS